MQLPLFIARRYLFAKKSHNVINIISLISAIGIAIGTAALIVVLSVYNGFDSIVSDIYGTNEADILILPSKGKTFSPQTPELLKIKADSKVFSFLEIVEENVFVTYDGKQGIATIKGVDSLYQATTPLKDHMVDGEFDLLFGQISQAVVGRGLAREMRIMTRFLDPLDIYFPAKGADISILNPMSSLRKETLFPVGIVSLEQNFDNKYIFIPIETARRVLGLSDEVTSLEINLNEGVDVDSYIESISPTLQDYIIKNRYQQNETIYKMMTYEKVAIYMILLFIILIISCNIFGSLSMLIIEKRDDIKTLQAMGASDKLIKNIFIFEGWLISLFGVIVGMIVGVGLCLIQRYFGVIGMPGNFIIDSYPVIIKVQDVLLSVSAVAVIGFLIAILPTRKNIFN